MAGGAGDVKNSSSVSNLMSMDSSWMFGGASGELGKSSSMKSSKSSSGRSGMRWRRLGHKNYKVFNGFFRI